MAILDTSSYRIRGPFTRKQYMTGLLTRLVREDKEFTVEWACDDTGTEATQQATFGTMFGGGFDLCDYGPDVPYGVTLGVYRETYRKELSPWTPVVEGSSSAP